MQMARSASHPLNYFQQTPVRGQLEPPDPHQRTGWRYLQCTDTPNELRVLIPPRTALVYSYLLRAEILELQRGETAAWDRLIQIRHLKDRMIRKCQRLARAAASKDKNTGQTMLFTCHAPPDFRLKEMERWFRDQGPEFVQKVSASTRGSQVLTGGNKAKATTTPVSKMYCCTKCGPLGVAGQQSRKPVAVAATRTAVVQNVAPPARSATVTRSNSASTTPPQALSAPPSRRPSRPHTPNEPPERPVRSTRPPERIPKLPSGTSTPTKAERELTPVPKIEVTAATPTDVQQSAERTPPASRASSRSTNRSSRKSIPTEQIPIPAIPAVVQQSDTPRSVTPQRSLESVRPASRTRSRSRSPHFSSQGGSRAGSLVGSLLETHPPRSAMVSPDPLPIPWPGTHLFPSRASISSPDPLPIPYRPRPQPDDGPRPQSKDGQRPPFEAEDFEGDSDSDDDMDDGFDDGALVSSPEPMHDQLDGDDGPTQDPSEEGTLIEQQNDQNDGPMGRPMLETIHEGSEAADLPIGRTLIRRRSSLKKRDSMSKMSVGSAAKSVTWAMDRDWSEQMSRYTKSRNEADVAAYELGELREHYHEEITMMKIVCRDAVVAAGLNVDALKHPDVALSVAALKRQEVALAEQENKVVAITDHMESKEAFYIQKVLNVLEEARQVVQLCDKKRGERDT